MKTARKKIPIIREIPRYAAAWARWTGSAQKFDGIDRQLEGEKELRHIRLTANGYQVILSRRDDHVARSFVGFGEESLERAKRFRDEMMRQRPPLRKNWVPADVLRALGLSEEVRGISRLASRSVYRVRWCLPNGKCRMRQFYFRRVPEADAYAAAINFLRELRAGRVPPVST